MATTKQRSNEELISLIDQLIGSDNKALTLVLKDIVTSMVNSDQPKLELHEILTGPLSAGQVKSIKHNLGLLQSFLSVRQDDNQVMIQKLCVDPENPQNCILIESSIDLIDGLVIEIIGKK